MRKLIASLAAAAFLFAGASAVAKHQARNCTSATESCAQRHLTAYLSVHPQYLSGKSPSTLCLLVSAKHFDCTWVGLGFAARGGYASVIRRGSAWKIVVGPPTCVETGSLQCLIVPSESMEPTLHPGSLVSVDLNAYLSANPADGDIVIFHPPMGADSFFGNPCGVRHSPKQACPQPTKGESSQLFVKRVVAGPGDTLSLLDGHPVVNGVENTNEPYTKPCGSGGACTLPKPIVILPGDYFVLGDYRGASEDSRFLGPIPKTWIVGKVVSY